MANGVAVVDEEVFGKVVAVGESKGPDVVRDFEHLNLLIMIKS